MKTRGASLALLCGLVLAPTSSRADGGALCLHETSGPFLVTVLTAPATLRAGPVDVSVMVEDSANAAIMLDADVDLRLQAERGGRTLKAQATRKQATNKLLQSAVIDLPTAGHWELTVSVRRGSEQAAFKTQLQVEPPLARFASVWPLVALPPLAALLFAGHQILRQRRSGFLE